MPDDRGKGTMHRARNIKTVQIYSPPVAELQKKGTIHCAPTKDTTNIYFL